MSITRATPPEGELLDIIHDISPLAWTRFQQRFPRVLVNGKLEPTDMSTNPPFISFRFEGEQASVVAALLQAVKEYRGELEWIMARHSRDPLPGINWRIIPRRVFEIEGVAIDLGMSSGQYMSKYEPELGPVAYDDLKGLTSHIQQFFLGQGK